MSHRRAREVRGVDRDQFWTLVEQTKGGDCQQHADRLTARLRELGPAGILAFQAVWDQLMDDSYRWDLWGAAYLANGGCSDDGFDYFRGWLIGQGRKVYETVLADPDSLAAHADGRDRRSGWGGLEVPVRLECEDLTVVAYWAYEAVTGQEPPLEPRPRETGAPVRHRPAGEDWDFDDLGEMRRRYPRVWAAVREQYDDDA
jgi:hypothetical protein